MPLEDFPDHFRRRFAHVSGGTVMVAVSGGPDSVALLHLLSDPVLDLALEVAHVHHGARGVEADRDAAFCERLAARLGRTFHLVRLETEERPPDGREASWRRHRYNALLELAAARCARTVATGHQRDDISEGLIVQLLRGAGPRALAGILAETESGVIRPLLPWRRHEILSWLRNNNLDWVEDSSNQDVGHLRNRVRQLILPDLRAASPRIDDHLVHLAAALAEDEAYFSNRLRDVAEWIDPWSPDGGIDQHVLKDLSRPLRTRWLHAQAARTGIGPVTRRQAELLHRMIESSRPRAVTLADRWTIRIARGRLWLDPPSYPAAFEMRLEEGGEVNLTIPGWRVRAARQSEPSAGARWSFRATSRCHLTVRSSRPDETVTVGNREVSVARMIARKVPKHLRPAWPLLCENARITWIPGVWQGPRRGDLLVEVFTNG